MPKATPPPNLLDRLTPGAIFEAFAELALAEGRAAVERGRVARPDVTGARADAVVVGADRRSHRARLTLVEDEVTSSCSCGAKGCGHAAALGLLLAGESRPEPGDDVEEPATAREDELRRRRSRGASELFEIRRRPGGRGGALGEYEVASPSARAYLVTLRALDADHGGCTCPDFATNLLGTCKHVEAVLHHLRTDAPRRFKRALRDGPFASYLHLAFEPGESIAIRLRSDAAPVERRLAARFFGPDGRLRGALVDIWPELARSAVEAGVEIPAEVAALGERATERARSEARLEGTLDGKRALFAAAVGDDKETVDLERSSMARRIATLLSGEFAASTGKAPAASSPDPVSILRERAGAALEQVVRLADGRLVGVVRGQAPASAVDGAVLLPAHAAAALQVLGSASPLAGAEVLYRAPAREAAADPVFAARLDLVTLAGRKRTAAAALAAAGQPGEALPLFREAMALSCRAMDPRGDPGAEPATLLAALHGHLLPGGLVTQAEAAGLARAGEAAGAFGHSTVTPPEPLVATVAADAAALFARASAAVRAGQGV